eukprot:scaffold2059_cov342-Prasinococcus_capsulatus_cf.AAC.8
MDVELWSTICQKASPRKMPWNTDATYWVTSCRRSRRDSPATHQQCKGGRTKLRTSIAVRPCVAMRCSTSSAIYEHHVATNALPRHRTACTPQDGAGRGEALHCTARTNQAAHVPPARPPRRTWQQRCPPAPAVRRA